MKKFSFVAALLVSILGMCVSALAEPPTTTKVNPHAVDYPLIRPGRYPSPKADLYEMHFGVRRWLNPLRITQDPDFDLTMAESMNWFETYGGYGVLGHGEDVFTRKGAHFRRTHRGR